MGFSHQSITAWFHRSTNVYEIKKRLENPKIKFSKICTKQERKTTYYHVCIMYFLTCKLLDLRNRRPRRLPSGILTSKVTAFSSSEDGSDGREASLAANCASNSCNRVMQNVRVGSNLEI